jgi:nucleolin
LIMPANEKSISEAILSTLSGADESFKVKKLRKLVLLSLQRDDDDKAAKKEFKKAVQALEKEDAVQLNEDGHIFLQKKKKEKKDKKKKKKRSSDAADGEPSKRSKSEATGAEGDEAPEEASDDPVKDDSPAESEKAMKDKNAPCKGNPTGVTRLFLGNLPFQVDEANLNDHLPGITHIKWITDKETGRFYGSAFVEMDTAESAAAAVAKAGQELLGRALKLNFAPSRPGDVWPPVSKVQTGGGQAGGKGLQALGAQPADCVKLFVGNLSYEIDDEAITKFFASVDAEMKAVRWLSHRDTGDFKGVGFVEFWNTEVSSLWTEIRVPPGTI